MMLPKNANIGKPVREVDIPEPTKVPDTVPDWDTMPPAPKEPKPKKKPEKVPA